MPDEHQRPAPRPGFSAQRRTLGGGAWAISLSYSGRSRTPTQARRNAIAWRLCIGALSIGIWALLLIRALHGQAADLLAVATLAATQGYVLILNLLGRCAERRRRPSAPDARGTTTA